MVLKAVTEIMPISYPGSNRGFSLLELIVVVVLIAAASAIVLPSFSGVFTNLQVETAGRDMATVMKQARSFAIGRQRPFRVMIALNEYSREAVEYILADEYGRAMKVFPLPDGVRFVSESRPEGTLPGGVSFYPSGRSSGGVFYLSNAQGRKVRIVVDPITGFSVVETLEDQK